MKLKVLSSGCGIKKRKGVDSYFHYLKDEADFIDSIKRYKYLAKTDNKQFSKDCYFRRKFNNSQITNDLYFKHYKEIESIKIQQEGHLFKMIKNKEIATYNLIIDHEIIQEDINLYVEMKDLKTLGNLTDNGFIAIMENVENQIEDYLATHNITNYSLYTISHDSTIANDLLLTLTNN